MEEPYSRARSCVIRLIPPWFRPLRFCPEVISADVAVGNSIAHGAFRNTD